MSSTRSMWASIWPDAPPDKVPVSSLTNGVHAPTWVSSDMALLFECHLGKDWVEHHDDPAFAAVTSKYSSLLSMLRTTVGRTDVQLDMKSEDVRTKETNVGDFIADLYRKATAADIGLVNGGSIRADTTIKPGVLTNRDVLSILPFNNRLVKMQLKGAVVKAALEHGVASIGQESQPGRFPQVAGIRFEYDATRPPGSRVSNVTVNGKPLDDDGTYTVATTSYVAIDGGDGYKVFQGAPLLIRPEQGPAESDILVKAIKSVKAIAPKTDGRIKRLDVPQNQTECR